jgi:hypothetical protein
MNRVLKRFAVASALAAVSLLSACGQAETPPEDPQSNLAEREDRATTACSTNDYCRSTFANAHHCCAVNTGEPFRCTPLTIACTPSSSCPYNLVCNLDAGMCTHPNYICKDD